MKRLMVIDSLNLFIRNYVVSPQLSSNGQPIGGLIGYLRSLQKYIREIKPDEIIIVWDGPGGSRKKKSIISNYKEGRSPIRLNRNVKVLSEDQEMENKVWQQYRLIDYLNNFPIMQFLETDIEADDLISFVVQHRKYDDWQKIIVSSDKDFIQLCNSSTVLFRPIQNEILTWKKVLEEYGIHPANFAVARSMAGDKSDNIPGIPGVGLKTVSKFLPMLAEDRSVFFDEVEEVCQQKVNEGAKTKFYHSVLDNSGLMRNNYRGMQLYAPSISAQVALKTRDTINNFVYELNITDTTKMLLEDGVGQANFEEMYSLFRKIVKENSND
jgi:DNA polymerase-1